MTDFASALLRRSRSVRMRRIGGELHVALDKNGYVFSDSAERIWLLCDGALSASEIVEIIAAENGEDASAVQDDVMAFIAELVDQRMIDLEHTSTAL